MRDIALQILHEGTVIPALPLVLNKDRKLDEEKQRRLIRYYLEAGVGGLAVAVHTTQFEIRDTEINLFDTILDLAVEEVKVFEKNNNKTIVLVAGVCGEISQAVNEANKAKSKGYDAVLLSPGGLKDYEEEYLIQRTKEVAAIMPVIGFYLQPSVGGRAFTFSYWESVCEIENVVAIKAAPFNRYLTLDVARAVACSSRKDKIALYTGNDDNIVVDLMSEYVFDCNGEERKVRFIGGLLGHWAVWTSKAVSYYQIIKEAVKNNAITQELLTLANDVTDANSAFFDTAHNFQGCIVGIHEVLRRQGLIDGVWTLNENEELVGSQKTEIDRVYKLYPHLNDDNFVKEFLNK